VIAIPGEIEPDNRGGVRAERTDETLPPRSEIMIYGSSAVAWMFGGATGS
jgi:hypothetical protein